MGCSISSERQVGRRRDQRKYERARQGSEDYQTEAGEKDARGATRCFLTPRTAAERDDLERGHAKKNSTNVKRKVTPLNELDLDTNISVEDINTAEDIKNRRDDESGAAYPQSLGNSLSPTTNSFSVASISPGGQFPVAPSALTSNIRDHRPAGQAPSPSRSALKKRPSLQSPLGISDSVTNISTSQHSNGAGNLHQQDSLNIITNFDNDSNSDMTQSASFTQQLTPGTKRRVTFSKAHSEDPDSLWTETPKSPPMHAGAKRVVVPPSSPSRSPQGNTWACPRVPPPM